jgi:ATP-dependent DNA helicase RecG
VPKLDTAQPDEFWCILNDFKDDETFAMSRPAPRKSKTPSPVPQATSRRHAQRPPPHQDNRQGSLELIGGGARSATSTPSIPAAAKPDVDPERTAMMEQRIVDKQEADRILALEEGHFLDFKAVEITPAKLSESISAFGNTAGGELFVGIGESGTRQQRYWNGFTSMESANGLFQVLNRMTPLSNNYHAAWISCPGAAGHVLHLVIPKTKDIVIATDGNPYVRRNAQNLKVSGADALQRLRLDKGIATFEDDVVNVDQETITNSMTTLQFILDQIPSAEPDEWMRKQNLLSEKRPIVAGVLLFSDEPQAALPKRSAIKIFRYGSREEEGRRDQLAGDPVTIEGCLYKQIFEAVERTKKMVEEVRALTPAGLAQASYPHETLHEIITNAVLHRDYSIAADVQVRVFDNRIEVESPGRLPGHVTTQNILREQSARNPKVVRLINKFPNPPNKDVGEGLNTAFEAMKKLRLKEPEIEEGQHSVVVHIRHTPLASAHDTVMDYLSNNGEISNKTARELTGIRSENAMKRVFLALKRRNLIEPVPGKSMGGNARWQKLDRSKTAKT